MKRRQLIGVACLLTVTFINVLIIGFLTNSYVKRLKKNERLFKVEMAEQFGRHIFFQPSYANYLDWFNMNTTEGFMPHQTVSTGVFIDVFLYRKDGSSIKTQETFRILSLIDNSIRTYETTFVDKRLTMDNTCAKFLSECYVINGVIIKSEKYQKKLLDGEVNYPTDLAAATAVPVKEFYGDDLILANLSIPTYDNEDDSYDYYDAVEKTRKKRSKRQDEKDYYGEIEGDTPPSIPTLIMKDFFRTRMRYNFRFDTYEQFVESSKFVKDWYKDNKKNFTAMFEPSNNESISSEYELGLLSSGNTMDDIIISITGQTNYLVKVIFSCLIIILLFIGVSLKFLLWDGRKGKRNICEKMQKFWECSISGLLIYLTIIALSLLVLPIPYILTALIAIITHVYLKFLLLRLEPTTGFREYIFALCYCLIMGICSAFFWFFFATIYFFLFIIHLLFNPVQYLVRQLRCGDCCLGQIDDDDIDDRSHQMELKSHYSKVEMSDIKHDLVHPTKSYLENISETKRPFSWAFIILLVFCAVEVVIFLSLLGSRNHLGDTRLRLVPIDKFFGNDTLSDKAMNQILTNFRNGAPMGMFYTNKYTIKDHKRTYVRIKKLLNETDIFRIPYIQCTGDEINSIDNFVNWYGKDADCKKEITTYVDGTVMNELDVKNIKNGYTRFAVQLKELRIDNSVIRKFNYLKSELKKISFYVFNVPLSFLVDLLSTTSWITIMQIIISFTFAIFAFLDNKFLCRLLFLLISLQFLLIPIFADVTSALFTITPANFIFFSISLTLGMLQRSDKCPSLFTVVVAVALLTIFFMNITSFLMIHLLFFPLFTSIFFAIIAVVGRRFTE
ncbi:hypothetical protein SNEBB_002993 [Seison nebaliae]|nr:hypothetical protein SNEBB_002993 [Seison nebaliae]